MKSLELFEKISLLIAYIVVHIIALLWIIAFTIRFILAFNFLLWNMLTIIFFGMLIYSWIKQALITVFDEIKDIKTISNEEGNKSK